MASMQASTSDPSLMDRLHRLGDPKSQRPIFKVHDILRNVNRKAYEPEIVSIGPYHWRKESLRMMEDHKLRYLEELFATKVAKSSFRAKVSSAVTEIIVDKIDTRGNACIAAVETVIQEYKSCKPSLENWYYTFTEELRELAEEALEKYGGLSFTTLNPVEFVDMLMLDGCFIIELLRKATEPELRTKDDPIFEVDWMRTSLQRDLLLLENQLPFNVLCKLFDLIDGPGKHKRLAFLAFDFFRNVFYGLDRKPIDSLQESDVEHLLDLIHICWNPQLPKSTQAITKTDQGDRRFFSAKRIIENGVVFKKSKSHGSLFAIEFREKKVRFHQLRCQQLIIEGRTETFFRNFIAYEQYFKATKGNFLTDYVNFLGSLIDSAEDVELLCHHRLLDNKLGDSKSVADLFIKINECVTIQNLEDSPYAQIYHQLNEHCNEQPNYWKAKMWESYCNPWGIASIILAIFGICFSVVMLAFAVVNYKFNTKHHLQPN